MRRSLALAAVLASLFGVALGQAPTTTLVFTNPQLVDLDGRRLRRVSAIVVADGRVAEVKASGGIEPPADAEVVDASRLILVQGLVDAALSLAPTMHTDAAYVQLQALRWGITTARAIDGPLAWAEGMRARVERGEVLSPRLVLAAPRLNGPPPGSGLRHPLTATHDEAAYGTAAASRLVSDAARGRARWVRIGPWASPDVVNAVVASAQKAGLRVSIEPATLAFADAARGGVSLIEGLGTTGAGPGASSGGAAPGRDEGGARFDWDRATAGEVAALAARLARSRVVVAPMLRLVAPAGGRLGEAWAREEDQALPRALRAHATAARNRSAGAAGGATAWTRQQQFVREFVARGGRLVVATGAGAEGWPVPGLALHQELDALAGAGVAPADALLAATAHGADLLEQAAGGWQKGMPANFVAVTGNPLIDQSVLRTPAFVVNRGERLDPAVLARDAARLASGGR